MPGVASQNRAAIAGVGAVAFGRFESTSLAPPVNIALNHALEDAGLLRTQVDGMIVQIGSPRGLDFDEMAQLLGLRLRFASQTWSHGRFCGTVVQQAAMAVAHKLADYVVCVCAYRNSAFPRHGSPGFPGFGENFRETRGPHAETPHVGLVAPIGGAALAAQRYFHRYAVDPLKLSAISVAQRNGAMQNSLAALRTPISKSDYAASPYVVEPLRLLDCSIPVDAAVALIVTTSERAADLNKSVVNILAFQGMHAGPDEFVFGQNGLGIGQSEETDYVPAGAAEPVFRAAQLSPRDIDLFYCYDGFSPQVLWTLERFGFAKIGEAADWVQDGRIELGGQLPLNTNGGNLSEGHTNGWGHMIEIVRQLRGEAGPRQAARHKTALWATTFGDAIAFGHA
jgi:acetyl-CoA acetyltransferase